MPIRTAIAAVFLVAFGNWSALGGVRPPRVPNEADNPPAKSVPMPTETSMHDFMEGVFQGPYRRLKAAIATEPKDNAGWKAIRSEAMILAEGGNLILLRKPEKDVDKWNEYSIASRDAGAELFKAAKKKDYAESKKAYAKMLTACNDCHKKFDDGKNQLMP
jgi:cytochrome c553